jgi:hypothetical protein
MKVLFIYLSDHPPIIAVNAQTSAKVGRRHHFFAVKNAPNLPEKRSNLVRRLAWILETLIYYQKRSECIDGSELSCDMMVRNNFCETVLIAIHNVTFMRQAARRAGPDAVAGRKNWHSCQGKSTVWLSHFAV